MLRPWVADQALDHLAGSVALLERVEPVVRAFTHLDVAGARAAAVEAVGRDAPLAGMPIAVKEIIDVAGAPVGFGSAVHAGRVPTRDAEAVSRLRSAGAVVLGVTTSTPFACGSTTVTTNPHRSAATPGGSSAGSGAAVGAGVVPVALATQSQASTLRPASYCGAYGFKPTHGRLPMAGVRMLAPTLDDLGLVTASPADLRAVLPVLNPDWRHVPPPTALRVGVVELDHGGLPNPRTWQALADLCAELVLGAPGVLDLELVRGTSELVAWDTAVAGSGQACFSVFAGESAAGLAIEIEAGETDPRLAEMVARAREDGPAGLAAARARRADLRAVHARTLDHVDLLLGLSTTGPAPDGHAGTGCRRLPATSSLLGVPALSLPWLTVDGLPLGVQLLGAEGRDEELLAAAEQLDLLRRSAVRPSEEAP